VDEGGVRQAADAPLALRELAFVRPDELDAARAKRVGVGTRGGARPHARVHGRSDEHGPAMRERCLGEDVVGDPVGELRERIRRAGGDHEQVGPRQVRVEILAGRPAREREEGLLGDEALRPGRDERDHLVSRLDEQARQLACLVGRDTAGDSQENPAHAAIMPARPELSTTRNLELVSQ
jgi:hypothetical protein